MTEEELREENERLKAAIEWALDPNKGVIPHQLHRFELHARAYPEPETEEVEVVRWECSYCEAIIRAEKDHCPHCNASLIKLTGTRTIPKPRKVKRREEITCTVTATARVVNIPFGAKFFAEWEE